ncbi:MAG: alpha/beta fold hydrolase [Acidobacteriota bacterium]
MPLADLTTGVRIFYEERGQGTPLLLLMGTGADHTFWSAQVPAFADHYRVIVYDARGVGRSRTVAPPHTCTMGIMAEDAAALLRYLGAGPAHVSGLSLGSTVAQELALAHPDQVRSLQLHGTWGRTDAWFRRMIETLEEPIRRANDQEAFIRTALMWILSPVFLQENPEEVKALERAFLQSSWPPTREGLLGHLHADRTHDALDRLPGISAPTLITSGEQDIQVPPRYGRAVARRIPGARFHLFEGPHASHLSCMEMPEEFNRVGLEFLASTEPASGDPAC